MTFRTKKSSNLWQNCLFWRRVTATFVIIVFTLFEAARYAPQGYASPSVITVDPGPAFFSIPQELGKIEEVYFPTTDHRLQTTDSLSQRERDGVREKSLQSPVSSLRSRSIVFIQDAHDSLEAQENIAKIINLLVREKGIKTVFEEGYEGPVPTDKFFGFIKDPAIKQKVSYFLLDKLRIGGAEYAHINRRSRLGLRPQPTAHSQKAAMSFPHAFSGNPENGSPIKTFGDDREPVDWQLIGVDDLKLYRENIRHYQSASKNQKETEDDLALLFARIATLAGQFFPKDLKTILKKQGRFHSGQLPLLDYLKDLRQIYLKASHFIPAPSLLPPKGGEDKGEGELSPEISKRRIKNEELWAMERFFAEYPALSLLLMPRGSGDRKWLDEVNRLDSSVIFKEMGKLEAEISKDLLKNERDQKIFGYYRGLKLLRRLNRIELSPAEYEAVKETLRDLQTQGLAEFVASQTHKSLVLSKEWEQHIKDPVRFYEAAHSRDSSVAKALDQHFSGDRGQGTGDSQKKNSKNLNPTPYPLNSNAAILVYGGFHANRIKEILRGKGFSYAVISPRFNPDDKRHQAYYKQLMSTGYHSFEMPLHVARAARPESEFVIANTLGGNALHQRLAAMASLAGGLPSDLDPATLNKMIEQSLMVFDQAQPQFRQKTAAPSARSEVRTEEIRILRKPLTHTVVTIDGMAASGKGIVARKLAKRLGFKHVDTGMIYRALAQKALASGISVMDSSAVEQLVQNTSVEIRWHEGKARAFCDGRDVTERLRTSEVDKIVAEIAKHRVVSEFAFQIVRDLGETNDIVAEGRNMGTDVFPDAAIKFFLTVDLRERARRRLSAYQWAGVAADFETVMAALAERDKNDSQRLIAPLRQAEDAVVIDNTSRDAMDAVHQMETIVRQRAMNSGRNSGNVQGRSEVRATEVPPIAGIKPVSYIWKRLFQENQIPMDGTIVEVAPGDEPKIGNALALLQFHGTIILIEPDRITATSIRRKYQKLLPQATVKVVTRLLQDVTVGEDIPSHVDALVANHPFDDMAIASAMKTAPAFFFSRETQDGMHVATDIQAVYDSIGDEDYIKGVLSTTATWKEFIQKLKPACFMASQYPAHKLIMKGLTKRQNSGFIVIEFLRSFFENYLKEQYRDHSFGQQGDPAWWIVARTPYADLSRDLAAPPDAMKRLGPEIFVRQPARRLAFEEYDVIYADSGYFQKSGYDGKDPREQARNFAIILDPTHPMENVHVFADRQQDKTDIALTGNEGSGRSSYYGKKFNIIGIGKTSLATSKKESHNNGNLELTLALRRLIVSKWINYFTHRAVEHPVVLARKKTAIFRRYANPQPLALLVRVDVQGMDRPSHVERSPSIAVDFENTLKQYAELDAEFFAYRFMMGTWSTGNYSLDGRMIDMDTASFVKHRGPYRAAVTKYPHNLYGYERYGFLHVLKQLAEVKGISGIDIDARFGQTRRDHLAWCFLRLLGADEDRLSDFLAKHKAEVSELAGRFEKLSQKISPRRAALNLFEPIPEQEDPTILDMSRLFRSLSDLNELSSGREEKAMDLLVRKSALEQVQPGAVYEPALTKDGEVNQGEVFIRENAVVTHENLEDFLLQTRNFVNDLFKLLSRLDAEQMIPKYAYWKARLEVMNRDFPTLGELTEKLQYWVEEYRSGRIDAETLGMETEKLCRLPDYPTGKDFELKDIPLFNYLKLAPHEMSTLLSYVEIVDFPRGATVVREGENADSLFILVQGTCKVDVGGQVVGEITNRGALVGEAVVSPEPLKRAATVTAETPARFLEIRKENLEIIMNIHPGLRRLLLNILRQRKAGIDQKILNLDLFHGIDPEILRLFWADKATEQEFKAGQTIIRESEETLGVYGLLKGSVTLSRSASNLEMGAIILKDEPLTQGLFGEQSVIFGRVAICDVIATMKESVTALFLHQNDFKELLAQQPQLLINCLGHIDQYLKSNQARELLIETVRNLLFSPGRSEVRKHTTTPVRNEIGADDEFNLSVKKNITSISNLLSAVGNPAIKRKDVNPKIVAVLLSIQRDAVPLFKEGHAKEIARLRDLGERLPLLEYLILHSTQREQIGKKEFLFKGSHIPLILKSSRTEGGIVRLIKTLKDLGIEDGAHISHILQSSRNEAGIKSLVGVLKGLGIEDGAHISHILHSSREKAEIVSLIGTLKGLGINEGSHIVAIVSSSRTEKKIKILINTLKDLGISEGSHIAAIVGSSRTEKKIKILINTLKDLGISEGSHIAAIVSSSREKEDIVSFINALRTLGIEDGAHISLILKSSREKAMIVSLIKTLRGLGIKEGAHISHILHSSREKAEIVSLIKTLKGLGIEEGSCIASILYGSRQEAKIVSLIGTLKGLGVSKDAHISRILQSSREEAEIVRLIKILKDLDIKDGFHISLILRSSRREAKIVSLIKNLKGLGIEEGVHISLILQSFRTEAEIKILINTLKGLGISESPHIAIIVSRSRKKKDAVSLINALRVLGINEGSHIAAIVGSSRTEKKIKILINTLKDLGISEGSHIAAIVSSSRTEEEIKSLIGVLKDLGINEGSHIAAIVSGSREKEGIVSLINALRALGINEGSHIAAIVSSSRTEKKIKILINTLKDLGISEGFHIAAIVSSSRTEEEIKSLIGVLKDLGINEGSHISLILRSARKGEDIARLKELKTIMMEKKGKKYSEYFIRDVLMRLAFMDNPRELLNEIMAIDFDVVQSEIDQMSPDITRNAFEGKYGKMAIWILRFFGKDFRSLRAVIRGYAKELLLSDVMPEMENRIVAASNVADEVERMFLREGLEKAISRLDKEAQEIIKMFLAGYTEEEISEKYPGILLAGVFGRLREIIMDDRELKEYARGYVPKDEASLPRSEIRQHAEEAIKLVRSEVREDMTEPKKNINPGPRTPSMIIVGGTFDDNGGVKSSIVEQMHAALPKGTRLVNGGHFNEIRELIDKLDAYDVVMWFPNIPNDKEKHRDIRERYPHKWIVTSKRNHGHQYSESDIAHHAAELGSDLVVEFSDTVPFRMKLMDPEGNVFERTTAPETLAKTIIGRLAIIQSGHARDVKGLIRERTRVNGILVGGVFDPQGGRRSSLIDQLHASFPEGVDLRNGGSLEDLKAIQEELAGYEVVLWFPEVGEKENSGLSAIKQRYPFKTLIAGMFSSGRDDPLRDMVNKALGSGSNLFVAFSGLGQDRTRMELFDPLSNQFTHTEDPAALGRAITNRLEDLKGFSRQGTASIGPDRAIPDSDEFESYLNIVRAYGERFHHLIHPAEGVERFLGNTAFRASHVFPGRPEWDRIMLISQRNVDKRNLGKPGFVAVQMNSYKEPRIVYYGNRKPSVDTPAQVRFMDQLNNVNYILHSHVYIDGAPFTHKLVPCGSLEEVAEVMALIGDDRSKTNFAVNLLGHGSIIFAKDLEFLGQGVKYSARSAPELLTPDGRPLDFIQRLKNALKQDISRGEKREASRKESAVILLLKKISGKWQFLLTQRSLDIIYGGQWTLPGGVKDAADASLKDTALREALEEIGVAVQPDNILGILPAEDTQDGMFRIFPFVAFAEDKVELRTNGEVMDQAWIPVDALFENKILVSQPSGPVALEMGGATRRILNVFAEILRSAAAESDGITVDGTPSLRGPERTLGRLFLNDQREKNEAVFRVFQKGEFRDVSWKDLHEGVLRTATALIASGVGKGDKVAILSEDRIEFIYSDLAALLIGAVSVPIFPSNSPEQIEYILRDTGAKIIIVSNDKQYSKVEGMKNKPDSLKQVVVMDQMGTFWARGIAVEGVEVEDRAARVLPTDTATITYTSGTTGGAKGVVLTHDNILSQVEGTSDKFRLGKEDVFVPYLALAHMGGRGCIYTALFNKVSLTLPRGADVGSLEKDFREIRPTVIFGVPSLVLRVRAHIQSLLREKGIVPGSPEARDLVISFFGGRLRYLQEGGAKLDEEIVRFFDEHGIVILEAYGLTETSAGITYNTPSERMIGSVGRPIDGVRIKIDPKTQEVLVRGHTIMREYWNKPEQTAGSLADGWFHTGDRGELIGGFLKITGRIKDLIVTAGGSNVAREPIENALLKSRFVSQAHLVGEGQKFVAALIVPDMKELAAFAHEKGILHGEDTDLLNHPQVKELLWSTVEAVNGDLDDYEKIRRIGILRTPFTVESGELGGLEKKANRVVEQSRKEMIEDLYQDRTQEKVLLERRSEVRTTVSGFATEEKKQKTEIRHDDQRLSAEIRSRFEVWEPGTVIQDSAIRKELGTLQERLRRKQITVTGEMVAPRMSAPGKRDGQSEGVFKKQKTLFEGYQEEGWIDGVSVIDPPDFSFLAADIAGMVRGAKELREGALHYWKWIRNLLRGVGKRIERRAQKPADQGTVLGRWITFFCELITSLWTEINKFERITRMEIPPGSIATVALQLYSKAEVKKAVFYLANEQKASVLFVVAGGHWFRKVLRLMGLEGLLPLDTPKVLRMIREMQEKGEISKDIMLAASVNPYEGKWFEKLEAKLAAGAEVIFFQPFIVQKPVEEALKKIQESGLLEKYPKTQFKIGIAPVKSLNNLNFFLAMTGILEKQS